MSAIIEYDEEIASYLTEDILHDLKLLDIFGREDELVKQFMGELDRRGVDYQDILDEYFTQERKWGK